jgi:hypothetical protein
MRQVGALKGPVRQGIKIQGTGSMLFIKLREQTIKLVISLTMLNSSR